MSQGLKSFYAVISYRPAMSERTLTIKISLNLCSVAADCTVPPGETLLEGLITGHPVCAEPRWLPRCLLHNGSVVSSTHQVFVHTDVMPYTSQRHLEQQLQLSFPATTGCFQPLSLDLLLFRIGPSQNSCPGIKVFLQWLESHSTFVELLSNLAFFLQQLHCFDSNINTPI